MSDTPQRDEIDRALAIDASYLDDTGFTERVIARLPRRRRRGWAGRWAIALFSLAAALLAPLIVPLEPLTQALVAVDGPSLTSTTFIASAVSLVVILWTAVTAAIAET